MLQSGVIRMFYPVFSKSYETIFVWVSYFLLLHFCSQRIEGSLILDTFENVRPNIRHTSINIE